MRHIITITIPFIRSKVLKIFLISLIHFLLISNIKAQDEKEVWVVDQKNIGLHVFDVSGLPEKPPVWKQFIKTNTGNEKDKTGNFLYSNKAIYGQPGWIMGSMDGKYFYTETGEIINTGTKRIIGHLVGANGKFTHSRFALAIDFNNSKVVNCGDQFVIGGITQ